MNNRLRGMLYSVAIGDALGIPHEFSRISPKLKYTGIINTEHTLKIQFQYVTTEIPSMSVSDDTNMTLALLEALINNNLKYDQEKVALAYMEFANNQTTGMGRNTRRLFKGVKTYKGYKNRYNKLLESGELQKCQSNGSLMRASPLVLLDNFVDDHALSNLNIINEQCNRVFLFILKEIFNNSNKDTIKKLLLENKYEQEIEQTIKDSLDDENVRDMSTSKGWVLNTLFIALQSFFAFDDFSEAMKYICLIPNSDTDTNMSVTGALFGAYQGFSKLNEEKITLQNINIMGSTYTGKRIDKLLDQISC